MTTYEKWLLAVEILGGLVLLFFFLDAVLARPVHVRTRLVEPGAVTVTSRAGRHRPEVVGGRS